jgi:hypothetical protein
MTRCWLFHDWESWEDYDAPVVFFGGRRSMTGEPIQGTEPRQRRRCRRCGLIRTRRV